MSRYDFRTLSPPDFEELVRDLLQANLGIRLESFGAGRDLGIDFRFATAGRTTIVQAKHYVDSGFEPLLRAVRLEEPKVRRLTPTRYILATSVSLSPSRKQQLQTLLPSAPLALADIIGREDLNNLLGLHPDVERRHFKLWMSSTAILEQVVHSGLHNRTQSELSEIQSLAPKFVSNDSVPRALSLLEKHGALIISGQPGVGKTTLARILVSMHIDMGWKVSAIDSVADAFASSSPGENRLVFFDDFLGQVRLTPDGLRSVDQRLPSLLHKAKASKAFRFIMTTRDYILHQAREQSDRLSDASVRLSEYVLDVGTYTRSIKARILYNHIYFSNLARPSRNALLENDFFLTVIDHRNFNPRLISLFTSADYVQFVSGSITSAFMAALEHPEILWEKPYRQHITQDGRVLMLSLFFNGDHVSLRHLENSFRRLSPALGNIIHEADASARFRAAVRELEGSVLSIQERRVSFSNPGVRDFLQRAIIDDNILPLVVGAVEELAELKHSWMLWLAQGHSLARQSPMNAAWSDASARVNGARSGSALERLVQFLDMHEASTEKSIFLHPILGAARDLTTSDLDANEAQELDLAFDTLLDAELPRDLHRTVETTLANAAAKMLLQFGGAMHLDEIAKLDDRISKALPDSDLPAKAVRSALTEFVGELSTALSNISSAEDLDGFEDELIAKLQENGMDTDKIRSRLEDRRMDLLSSRREWDTPSRGYGLTPPSRSSGETLDSEIRSLFSSLWQVD